MCGAENEIIGFIYKVTYPDSKLIIHFPNPITLELYIIVAVIEKTRKPVTAIVSLGASRVFIVSMS